jgi:hypothetical protein
MPTALIIGAVVAGGTSVASSVIGSHAATSAAQTQAAAGQKALDLEQQVYAQQRADLAPYRAIGNQGLLGLSNLQSQPTTMDPSGNGWSTLKNPNVAAGGTGPGTYGGYFASLGPTGAPPPATGTAVPRGQAPLPSPGAPPGGYSPAPPSATPRNPGGLGGPATMGTSGLPTLTSPGGSGGAGSAAGGPQMRSAGVLLRAPNGQTQVVDPSLVQHYVAQGAQIVGQ